ncbi:hypothetical protein ACWF94_21020 [Streptomyces sp. NPDC055078]
MSQAPDGETVLRAMAKRALDRHWSTAGRLPERPAGPADALPDQLVLPRELVRALGVVYRGDGEAET